MGRCTLRRLIDQSGDGRGKSSSATTRSACSAVCSARDTRLSARRQVRQVVLNLRANRAHRVLNHISHLSKVVNRLDGTGLNVSIVQTDRYHQPLRRRA